MGAQSRSPADLMREVGLPDRYPIVRRIARGGMASVWCAHDVILGRRVAIKLLAEQYAHDRGAVMRFQREARAAARLSAHPNVVTIFDVGRTATDGGTGLGRPFIVMECLAGGTVGDAIQVGEFSRSDALRWVHEAAAALDYAHGRGVIHRDIKPANLLLDNQRVLHVADFGIARVVAEDTITSAGELFGTAAYISPEQALGRPATEASDRYALAVVAYELLVGERPFAGESFAVQAHQHVDETPPRASSRNRELPRAVDAVLARGMAKAREQRWASATEFAQALDAALQGDAHATTAILRPTPARPTPARPAAARSAAARPGPAAAAALPSLLRRGTSSRQRPRALAAGALAAVALAILVAVLAGQGGAPRRARIASASTTQLQAPHHVSTAPPRHNPAPNPHRSATAKAAVPPPAPAAPVAPAGSSTAAPSADALEARGHALLSSGQPSAAVGVLRQAVATASPSSMTYAYALYDLGDALLRSGDPRSAAVVLQRRLQIPNQTEVVRETLQQALRQIGAQVNAAGPPAHRGHGASGDNSD